MEWLTRLELRTRTRSKITFSFTCLGQQGRIQVLAYLIGSKPYLGISPENRYFVAGLEEKVVWC